MPIKKEKRKVLGELIRKKRSAIGITQTEMAERLNITQGQVGKIERGEVSVTLERLEEICSRINQNMVALLSEANYTFLPPEEEITKLRIREREQLEQGNRLVDNQPLIDKIQELLRPYIDRSDLECDGFTYIASHLLNEAKISHSLMNGTVSLKYRNFEDFVNYHCWIIVNGLVLDYRLRSFLQNKLKMFGFTSDLPYGEIPNGIFLMDDYPQIKYNGIPSSKKNLNVIFDILA